MHFPVIYVSSALVFTFSPTLAVDSLTGLPTHFRDGGLPVPGFAFGRRETHVSVRQGHPAYV